MFQFLFKFCLTYFIRNHTNKIFHFQMNQININGTLQMEVENPYEWLLVIKKTINCLLFWRFAGLPRYTGLSGYLIV